MIRLLSTDFDGTLIDHDSTPAVSDLLFDTISSLQKSGVLWAINTGRDLNFTLEGLRQYGFPIEPDYILTNEREVFHRNALGQWQDYGDWNQRCIEAHEVLFTQEDKLLQKVSRYVEELGSEVIIENDRLVGLVTSDEQEMERFVDYLHSVREPDSLFHYQRNTIFIRFCHAAYSKGTALGELARLTGLSRQQIFAAGDHHNDLSMLDGEYARWAAAPCNAIAEVKETVLKAGGYVASKPAWGGVLEALHYFFDEHGQRPHAL